MNIYRAGFALIALVLVCCDGVADSSSQAGGGEEAVRLIVLLRSSPLAVRLKGTKPEFAAILTERQAVETGRKTVIQNLHDRGLIQEAYREFGYLLNGFAATTRLRDRDAIAALPECRPSTLTRRVRLEPNGEMKPRPGQPAGSRWNTRASL